MQFTTFAFAAVLLSSPLAFAQAPASSFADQNPNYYQYEEYCKCVGFTGAPDNIPNNDLTSRVCNGWQGGHLVDAGVFLQCQDVGPKSIDGFANTCASYGKDGARGAKCCERNQEYQYCPIKIPGKM